MSLVLEMVSDLACPWCWLGLRRIRAALCALGQDGAGLALRFAPFELDPTIPPAGVDYRAYMRTKFGPGDEAGRTRWSQMREALEAAGAREDIPFDFAGITHRPNTFDAHRLLRSAQGQGAGLAVKEALFRAYFTEHLDIGDPAVLTAIAAAAGLDPAIVSDLLARDADSGAVREEQRLFLGMGIRGVPTFIAGRAVAIQGAHDVPALIAFLREAIALRS